MAYRGIFMQFIDTDIKPKEFDMYYLLQDLAENGTTAFILRPYLSACASCIRAVPFRGNASGYKLSHSIYNLLT